MITQPMLAGSEIPDLYNDIKYPCYIQPKHDGIRCLAINGVAYSRKMKTIPNRFVQKVFKDLNLHGLDGELMINGNFNDVQSGIMSEDGEPDFYLAVYDYWDSDQPFSERLKIYTNKVLELKQPQRVKKTQTVFVGTAKLAQEIVDSYVTDGFEGGILRSMDGKYKQGRSTFKEGYLLKLKSFLDDEATVVGFEEKMTNTNEKETDERGYIKRSSKKAGLIGADTLGSLVVVWKEVEFKIGSGFNDIQRKEIWENKEKYLGKLVTFQYQELSSYGVPRFPTFKGFRSDLDVS